MIISSNWAGQLPQNLSRKDAQKLTEVFGWGSAHKSWSSQIGKKKDYAFSLGLESSIFFARDSEELGDGRGNYPGTIPLPKLWMALNLPNDLVVSSSFSPGFMYGAVSSYGASLQWSFFDWREYQTTVSTELSYTYSNAFGDADFHSPSLMAKLSRSFQDFQIYGGLGLISAHGDFSHSSFVDSKENRDLSQLAFHARLGIQLFAGRWPVSLQGDLIGGVPQFALLVNFPI